MARHTHTHTLPHPQTHTHTHTHTHKNKHITHEHTNTNANGNRNTRPTHTHDTHTHTHTHTDRHWQKLTDTGRDLQTLTLGYSAHMAAIKCQISVYKANMAAQHGHIWRYKATAPQIVISRPTTQTWNHIYGVGVGPGTCVGPASMTRPGFKNQTRTKPAPDLDFVGAAAPFQNRRNGSQTKQNQTSAPRQPRKMLPKPTADWKTAEAIPRRL